MSVQLQYLGAGPQSGPPGRCGSVGTEPPAVLPVSLHNLPPPDVGCGGGVRHAVPHPTTCVSQTQGLWQPCLEQGHQRHVSNSTCSLGVPGPPSVILAMAQAFPL